MLVLEAAVSGLFTGGSYALVGVAITLMFRSTGVLSFAHAAFAALAAFVYVDFGQRGWPLPLAAAVAVLVATAYGLVVERVAVRPLVGANPATRLIATLGILTFTSGLLLWHYGFAPVVAEPLLPSRSVTILDVAVSYQKVAVLVTAAVLAAALAWFLDRTRFGTAVRAVAQDPEAARLHGISLGAVAGFNWGLGACLSAIVGVLVAPLQIVNVGTFTLLLTKSLAGTLVGGMASLPLTFLGGILVGVAEAIASVRFDQPGMREVAVLGLVVVVLLVRRTWAAAPTAHTEPRTRRRIRIPFPAAARPLVFAVAAAGGVIALVVPAGSTYWSFVGGRTLFFVIQALSLVMLVGWGGQVSLMQGAYVGVGALGTGYLVVEHGLALWLALLLNNHLPFKSFLRAIILLPWIVPTVLSAIAFWWMYDPQFSIISWTLIELGLRDSNVDFINTAWPARWSLIAANIWRGIPFVAISLLAGLQTISPSLYEAAMLDGATAWQRFRYVTFPMLLPILAIVMTFSIIFTFTDFQLVYAITRGGPVNSTHLLATLAFQRGIPGGQLGEGAAIAVAMVPFLVFATLFSYFALARRKWQQGESND